MATTQVPRVPAQDAGVPKGQHTHDTTTTDSSEMVMTGLARKGLGALRLAFGLTFLWAFVDKLLALGYATGKDPASGKVDSFGPAAWINGGSPTEGFLKFGVSPDNWFHGAFGSIGGTVWADWLFMLGLLGIGVALVLGIGMRLAAITGVTLYLLMWVASFPLANNPLIDDHLLGAISLIVLAATLAGNTWGFGKDWGRSSLVQRHPILR